jgi:hypothetical protein
MEMRRRFYNGEGLLTEKQAAGSKMKSEASGVKKSPFIMFG